MNQLKQFLELDKLLHFFVSGWIFFVLMIAFNSYDIGIITTSILFVGKEIYDKKIKKTEFNVKDALASFGGLVLSIVYWSIFNQNN